MATVIIAADICPIGINQPYFISGDAETLFHDLLNEFNSADLVIANLECPLIQKSSPILKTGPTFGEPSDCIKAIQKAGIQALCLANNHILDHGQSGLENTLAVCSRAGISTVGAGRTLFDAQRLLIRSLGSVRIGVLAMAEHEFSIASESSAGANPLDLIQFVRTVQAHKNDFDFLIVLVHGGDEFHVPSPRLKNTCRFMIEMGANAVIVQHPHVLGGYESYLNGHIVYGQGALVMDEPIYRDLKSFHQGFLVKLTFASEYASSMDIVPFVQSAPPPGAHRLTGEAETLFRRDLEQKAQKVKDDAWVAAQWSEFCRSRRHSYLSGLLGHNRFLSRLNRSGLVENFFHDRRSLLRAKNVACCETHREAIETIFSQL